MALVLLCCKASSIVLLSLTQKQVECRLIQYNLYNAFYRGTTMEFTETSTLFEM